MENYYSTYREEIIPFIPVDCKTLLDVGCSEGNFAQSIKKHNQAEVWGIEKNQSCAHQAEQKIDCVLCGDIQSLIPKIPDQHFDCITFNDVLEHLISPDYVLQQMKKKLTTRGIIVCSIPNILNISILKNLIFHRDWEYASNGILDKTHLRFFTQKSMRRMFQDLGFDAQITGINPTRSLKFKLFNCLTLFRFQETAFIQFVSLLRIKTWEGKLTFPLDL
jgi:2-polyprenyl-3-methyl-5-hydroxy-6-metoxy-1,4-benzoquinol methylase